jgi:hypothetical protein
MNPETRWELNTHGIIELRDGRIVCGGRESLWLFDPPERAESSRGRWDLLPSNRRRKAVPKFGRPMPIGSLRVLCLSLLEDGRVACGHSKFDGKSVTVWSIERGECEMSFSSFKTHVTCLSPRRGGGFLACGCGDGLIRILSLESGECARTLEAFPFETPENLVHVEWSVSNRLLGWGRLAGELKQWVGRYPSEMELEWTWEFGSLLWHCARVDETHVMCCVRDGDVYVVELDGETAPRGLGVGSSYGSIRLPRVGGMMVFLKAGAGLVVCPRLDWAITHTVPRQDVRWWEGSEGLVSSVSGVLVIRDATEGTLRTVSIQQYLPHSLRFRLLAWRRGFVEARSHG